MNNVNDNKMFGLGYLIGKMSEQIDANYDIFLPTRGSIQDVSNIMVAFGQRYFIFRWLDTRWIVHSLDVKEGKIYEFKK